jgi:hypothetical protein
VLTLQLISERKRLEGRIERLRTQHTEEIRDKSVAENKSRNLVDKVTTLEKEKEDLGHRLNDKKEDVENGHAEAQAARKRVADLELKLKNMRGHHEKTESAIRVGVDRAHTLFVDAYRDLGAQTAPLDKSEEEVGSCFFGWLQDELESLPSIVTCEGATNALSHEGCRNFEAFDWGNEEFDAGVFQIENDVLKCSAGALYDKMWGPYGCDIVERGPTKCWHRYVLVLAMMVCVFVV